MTAAREYSITYRGLSVPGTVGGVSTTLHDVHTLSVGSRDFSVSTLVSQSGPARSRQVVTSV